MTMTRRDFAKNILAIGAGINAITGFSESGLPSEVSHPTSTAMSRVVLARSEKLKRIGNSVDSEAASGFISAALMRLTDQTTPVSAWRSLFSSSETVAIKLSCLPGPALSSSVGVVNAVTEGLISAGIKAKNIYVWERTDHELERAGFKVGSPGVHVCGTDNPLIGGYSDNVEISGSVGTCFSRIMERVDALICIPVLKDHDIAGVSIGMKNFYGAIHNPNKYHSQCCDPYVADLCLHPYIRKKWRLTVCDATRIQIHNGPAFYPRYAVEYGGLLVSRDPVALDYTGWQIIESERKEKNLKSLKEENREPSYINTAARLKMGNATASTIQKIVIQ